MASVCSRTNRQLGVGLALLSLAVSGCASRAVADANQAKDLLKAMSAYVAGQSAISFDLDSSLDVVTKDEQRLSLASSGSVTVSRPDKVRATRRGGFADAEFVFDGKTLSRVEKEEKKYSQVELQGSIDKLIDELRTTYKRPLPAADLLVSDPYKVLMEDVVDVKDLGSGVIRGLECDHLAFRTKDLDWQIWIAHGSEPRPVRFSITSKQVKGNPQYTVDIMNWKTGKGVRADDFKFKAPAGAKKVEPNQLLNFDELPGMFKPGGAQ